MKLYFVFIILLNSAIGFAQYAEFNFIEGTKKDFGKVNEGQILEHYYVFENVGNVPLIIDEALVSCPCTTIEFPKSPILPNEKDSIHVTFDTNQKYYKQDRIIKLKANTKRVQKLNLRAFVVPKDE